MHRFKIGDAVLILPKFAHLYPSNVCTIQSVTADPNRSLFNEYAVQFSDGSTTGLFEFQLLENPAAYKTFVAVLISDIPHGQPSYRHLILGAANIDIDIKIKSVSFHASMIGQIRERDTANLLKDAEVALMSENISISSTTSDNFGFFRFDGLRRGQMNLLVTLPHLFRRILGGVVL